MVASATQTIRYADYVRITTRTRLPATSIVKDEIYTIIDLGNTPWALLGASNPAVGVTFTATGSGSGTGVVSQPMYYCFSTDNKDVFIPFVGSKVFTAAGQLIQIGNATRDIKSTANETSFTLVGIDPTMLGFVLGQDIKGSTIEAWHGFYNSSNRIQPQNLLLNSETLVSSSYVGIYTAVDSSSTYDGPFGQPDSFRVNYSNEPIVHPYFYQDVDLGQPLTGRTFSFSSYVRKAGTDPSAYNMVIETVPTNHVTPFDITSGKWFGYCGNVSNIHTTGIQDPTLGFNAIQIIRDTVTACGAGNCWGLLYSDSPTTFYDVGDVVTVRVWAKSSSSSGVVLNIGVDDVYMQSFTLTTGYVQYTATFTIAGSGYMKRGFQFTISAQSITIAAELWNPECFTETVEKFTTPITIPNGWTNFTMAKTFSASNTATKMRVGIECPLNVIDPLTSKFWTDCWQLVEGSGTTYVQTTSSPITGFYKFFTGVINSFSISEEWMEELRSYIGAITVSASSIQIILRNRIAGRFTNDSSWKFFYPSDNSMSRVSFISTLRLPFGKND